MADITSRAGVMFVPVAVPVRRAHRGAGLIEREGYTAATIDDYDLCGIAVHQEGQLAGTVHFRVANGGVESAFLVHDHFAYAFSVANPENGRYFTTEGRVLLKEVTATRIGETTFEFTRIEAGQTFVMRDADARAVLRDRGRARITLRIDTLRDVARRGEAPAVLDVHLTGPHPGVLHDHDGRFCSAVQQLLG
jgi:hypothetical protein